MRSILFVLPFVLVSPAHADLTVDSQGLTEAVQKICYGENPSKGRIALGLVEGVGGNAITIGHLFAKEMLIADGPQWPENYVEESRLNRLGEAALHYIQNGASCRQAMNASLQYQSVGLAARPALKSALGPLAKEVLAGSWLPASEEAIALHDQCTPKAFHFDQMNEREALGASMVLNVKNAFGNTPVYTADVLQELYWRYEHAALRAKAPKTCDDIAAIEHDLFLSLGRADIELHRKIDKVQARFGKQDNPSPEAASETPAPDSKPAP